MKDNRNASFQAEVLKPMKILGDPKVATKVIPNLVTTRTRETKKIIRSVVAEVMVVSSLL